MTDGGSDTSLQPLFRREVAQRRSNEWLGEVRVSTSLPLRVPLILGLVFVLCGLVLAVVSPYRQRVPVSGELWPIGGVISIDVDMPGTITAVHVIEGATVEAGQAMAVLRSPREIGKGDSVDLIEEELRTRARNLSSGLSDLDERERRIRSEAAAEIRSLEREQRALEEEGAINVEKTDIAEDVLKRVLRLREEGLISAVELSRYETDVLSAKLAELNRQRAVLSIRRQIDAVARDLSDRLADIEDRRAQFVNDLSAVRQEQTDLRSRSERVIRSPMAGRVSALLVEVGQSVGSGSALAKVTPRDAELEAVLLVPSQAVAALAEGTELMLRVEAYPYQRFGFVRAIVSNMSGTTLVGDRNSPAYRVRAKLDTQALSHNSQMHSLLPGMKIDSTVIVDYGSAPASILGTLRYHLKELVGG